MNHEIVQYILVNDDSLHEILAYNSFVSQEQNDINVFNALLRAIVGQQLSVKAAATIYQRFLTLCSDTPTPEKILELDETQLKAVGLSRQKSGYIQNIARHFLAYNKQEPDWKNISDSDIIKKLTSIKGVGVWTVQMLLMFTLHRTDVFPVDDLGIQQAMIKHYNLNFDSKKELKQEMVRLADKWKPYRTYVSRCLWAWKDA